MFRKANTWPKKFCECGVFRKLLTSHVFLTVFTLPTHKNTLRFPFFFLKQTTLSLKTIYVRLGYPIRLGALKVSPLKGFSCRASAPCARATFPGTTAGASVFLTWGPPIQWCRKRALTDGSSSQRCDISFCCFGGGGGVVIFLSLVLCTYPSCPPTSCTRVPSHPQNTQVGKLI